MTYKYLYIFIIYEIEKYFIKFNFKIIIYYIITLIFFFYKLLQHLL